MHFKWTLRSRNLGAQRHAKPSARRSDLCVGGCDVTRRMLSDPADTQRARGRNRDVSIAMACNQATMRCSGGRSRREARRAGRRHRGETGRRLTALGERRCPLMARAASLPRGPTEDGAVGSPDSSQGAELMHGLRSAPFDSGTGGGAGGRTLVPRRPQQHEA